MLLQPLPIPSDNQRAPNSMFVNLFTYMKKRCTCLGTYNSSSSPLFRASFAMHWNASSTLMPSLADVSKYGIFPFDAHQARAFFSETCKQEFICVHLLCPNASDICELWKE